MATLFGMALGGWMSGAMFDLTGSYRAAFLNGIALEPAESVDRVLSVVSSAPDWRPSRDVGVMRPDARASPEAHARSSSR